MMQSLSRKVEGKGVGEDPSGGTEQNHSAKTHPAHAAFANHEKYHIARCSNTRNHQKISILAASI